MFNSPPAPSQDVAIVFARAAVPGKVKTRMIPQLGPERACALHLACLGDVVEMLDRALPAAEKWLFWSEAPGPDISIGDLELPPSFGMALQSGLDLGERMGRALERALASGAQRVLLIGSDSPALPPEFLRQASDALKTADLVLGPSEDGGFYLIGARSFDRAIFEQVEWGGAEVFARTEANIRRCGLTLHTLPRWYDLDEWRDVERMINAMRSGDNLPPRLAALLKQWG
jgi:rSAM/selenodomain-associated transferase 1